MTSFRKTISEIDLDALKSNFSLLRSLHSDSDFICPMIKGNAYGHGDYQVLRALEDEGAKHFGVAMVEEAIRLVEQGFQSEHQLLVFCPGSKEAYSACRDYKFVPIVSSLDDLKLIANLCDKSQPMKVHLKLNTGMNRMGFPEEGWEAGLKFIQSNEAICIEGILTHLSDAEDIGLDSGESRDQLLKFKAGVSAFQALDAKYVHVFNSSGIFAMAAWKDKSPWNEFANWGCRPGIALYGGVPDASTSETKKTIENNFLKPVMKLTTHIAHIHKVKSGDSVSYGSRWRAEKDSTIATLPLGYADGVHRSTSGKLKYFGPSQSAKQVGTVCMDFVMIDISEWPTKDQVVGVPITLFGDGSPDSAVENWAKAADTISYEILTGISSRVPRKYLPTPMV